MTIFFFFFGKEGKYGLVLHVDKAVGARSGHDRETERCEVLRDCWQAGPHTLPLPPALHPVLLA